MADDESAIKLADVLPAVDRKDRAWWDKLKQAQKDKFPAWLYMRYSSSVSGNPDFARYYLMAVNETVNKRFNSIKDHPKLQYLLMTAASPGMGTQKHGWIAPGKRGKTDKKLKLFAKLYPNANDQELEILAATNTEDDILKELQDRGWTEKEIKAAMKGTDE